jgi:hypothetical protein
MPDNVGYTPGSGATVAADEVNGVLYQRVKPVHGVDGTVVDVSTDAPLPVQPDRLENLAVMLSRTVKILESNAVVDQQQRQRITLDSISPSLTLGTVTTVTTVTTVATVTTVTGLTNIDSRNGSMLINQTNLSAWANCVRVRIT